MEKKRLSVKEAYEMVGLEYTFWDWISTPFYRIRRFFYDRWFNFRQRCQRFRRGYSDSDVWDMDHWFIATLKPMMEQMLNTYHSHPGEITAEAWEDNLREMIACLTLMDEDAAKEHLGLADEAWSVEKHQQIKATMFENKKRFLNCLKNGSITFGTNTLRSD